MNDTELARFRALIADRLSQLAEGDRIGRDALAVVELDQQAIGRLSRMDALQNQAMAQAQQARRKAEDHRLRKALRRIETGDFGWCEECGEAIPPGRLRLDPAATRCVSCASR